jgi:protein-S-isoprenylcysteine O-methyltransferase Ste14
MAVRAFAVVAYLAFLAAFLDVIAFASGVLAPRTVDDDPAPLAFALFVDVALVAFFGAVHSIMARAWFKRAWAKLVPPPLERSVYVLVASAQLLLLCAEWRSFDAPTLWSTSGAPAIAIGALQAIGWATVLVSSFLIDHFELFGLRQAFARPSSSSSSPQPQQLRTPLLYRVVRHPLYLGIVVAIWSAPTMTASHALFASLMTAYVLIGAMHEERDLARVFGDEYRAYQRRVPMLVPLFRLPR